MPNLKRDIQVGRKSTSKTDEEIFVNFKIEVGSRKCTSKLKFVIEIRKLCDLILRYRFSTFDLNRTDYRLLEV